MKKYLLAILFSAAAFAQGYKVETIASAAPALPAAYAAVVEGSGYRVVGPKGPWCEIWLRKSIPTTAKSNDPTITLPIAQGTLIGILRFPGNGEDRRGQPLKAGVYTIRYSNFNVDGAHQGVAPQRDFGLLTPIANDPDPAAMPAFMPLVEMSRTAGNPHPAVFSLMPPAGGSLPSITKDGEHDYVLNVKAGDLGIGILVAGRAEG